MCQLPDKLQLQTRIGTDIANACVHEASQYTRNQFRGYQEKYPNVDKRTGELCFYNCHGLVFGSRRTWIEDASEVDKILREDGYLKVLERDIKLGDILIYKDADNGDVSHSAVVVEMPTAADYGIPRVLSKWSSYCEIIHRANYGPYSYANSEYYRIM